MTRIKWMMIFYLSFGVQRDFQQYLLQFTKRGANPRVLVIGVYELLGNPTT